MPFDHARCPGCNAIIDPERLKPGKNGPACPSCGETLATRDLFGLAANWAEAGDDDGNQLTLDDLVSGPSGGGSSGKGEGKKLTLENLLSGPVAKKKK